MISSIPLGAPVSAFNIPRQNTRPEAQCAEFLVLGQLLVEGIQAYKEYVNMPGKDVLAMNPEAKSQRVARVWVKSRWSNSYSHVRVARR
jgi:hypothetical protein